MFLSCFSYFPCDPPYVTDELRDAEAYQVAMDKLKTEMKTLQKEMQNSVPFYSTRYKVNYTCSSDTDSTCMSYCRGVINVHHSAGAMFVECNSWQIRPITLISARFVTFSPPSKVFFFFFFLTKTYLALHGIFVRSTVKVVNGIVSSMEQERKTDFC